LSCLSDLFSIGFFFGDVVEMGRRSTKDAAPARAASVDDAIRAAIIKDCISRAVQEAPNAQAPMHQFKPPEQEPTAKRQKLGEAAPAAYAAEMMRPAYAQQAAKGVQETVEIPWPVEQFALQLQSSTLEEFALSPMETELVFLREALAQSTEREETLTKMTKTLRIELHKAYRLIALQQLNSFTYDTETPIVSGHSTSSARLPVY